MFHRASFIAIITIGNYQNIMSNYQNEDQLEKLLTKSMDIISGEFEVKDDNALMDLDITDRTFRDCKIFGGDFCSSIFTNCTFDNVLFRKLALVGVSFNSCTFVKCKFSSIQADFDMINCKIIEFTITREE